MTAKEVKHKLIDYGKNQKQLTEEINAISTRKVSHSQVRSVLCENGTRGLGEIERILAGAEKVIRRWENEKTKN